MARPTDWRVLGLDSDPIPQDPDNLYIWAKSYHDYADQVARALSGTNGLLNDPALTGWLGASGQAFKDACLPFPGMLNTAEDAYRGVGDAWDDFSKQIRTLQPQFDSCLNQATTLLQKMKADGGLSDEDALACATSDNDAVMYDRMHAKHMENSSTLGPAGFENALDALSAYRAGFDPLRRQVVDLCGQYTGAKVKCENALNDAADLASKIVKSAGATGTNSMNFDDRFSSRGGNLADLVLSPDAALGLEDSMFPTQGTDPSEISWWWTSLSQPERDKLILEHADLVGALDGIPCLDRDKANRAVLDATRSSVNARIAYLLAHIPPTDGRDYPNPEFDSWNKELDDLRAKQAGLNSVYDRLNNHPDQPPAFLLGLDTAALGHAIVAINNPDTANNVVTYVPGTGSKLGNIAGDISRSDAMVGAAGSGPGFVTSSITWVGYDAPQNIAKDSPFIHYATDAELKLYDFETGLRMTHQGPASLNSIIGHSYGSTTVGFAMRDMGLPVDRVIFVGSPGVGVEHAADLHIDPAHVYIGAADNDPVANLPLAENLTQLPSNALNALGWATGLSDYNVHGPFGQLPYNPEFGAHTFKVAPGALWPPGAAHSQYWVPRSDSLRNIGAIITGNQPS
ncbi:uncharacterized protein YukE [Catenulispora sp. GAS73]|uniref:alpha/beta hydrolase n=1 Tax=Catenulispora sp. GAS73 TaxID=3156269 RepID=UPI0035151A11